MIKNELVNKWSKTGLLDNFDEIEKIVASTSLENMANFYIEKQNNPISDKCDNTFIARTILSVIVRLYLLKVKNIPATNWLFDDFVKYVETNLDSFKNGKYDDWEAEICSSYTDGFKSK